MKVFDTLTSQPKPLSRDMGDMLLSGLHHGHGLGNSGLPLVVSASTPGVCMPVEAVEELPDVLAAGGGRSVESDAEELPDVLAWRGGKAASDAGKGLRPAVADEETDVLELVASHGRCWKVLRATR
jgi:hypothetical protein